MATYLINATLCAFLLYAVYSLFLEKENMHRFKRMYLLLSLVFSMTVPLVTVNLFVPQLPENIKVFYADLMAAEIDNPVETGHAPSLHAASLPATSKTKSPVNYPLIIISLYGLITACLLFRLLKNSFQLLACGRNNPSIAYFDTRIVLIKEKLVPHSFGKYIFVNRTDYENGRIAEEIIIHEWAHIRQKHALDNIFMEVLIAFFWFNPVCYGYKKKIKLNHEFLADEAVIQSNRPIFDYQMLLINSIRQQPNIQLASNFNYLITKKRLIMMTKTTSKTRACCKMAALIPVFFAAILVFSTKTMAKELRPDAQPEQTTIWEEETLLTVGQGVSQELLDEYKAIESKYYESIKKTPDGGVKIKWKIPTITIADGDWKRLYVIYIQMNEEQRKEQYLYLFGPLNPIKRGDSKSPERTPNEIEWKYIKESEIIWLDGKRMENVALDSYAHTDIYLFWSYFENGNRHAVVWTEKGYEAYLKLYEKQISESKLLEIRPNALFFQERNYNGSGKETIVGSSAW